MSDSNGKDTINPDMAICNLTTTLDTTTTPVIGAIVASSTITNPGFSTTKIAHDKPSLAAIVSSLVGDRLLLDNQKVSRTFYAISHRF